ncbi:glutathione S-transferase family protein [Hwanghaeella grinnelliae]|uniref:Glutathione S-transferase family protein n=1 Tax=Hwanghaeella grinnelliae TaxID=2500179 RepID=A0A3S2W3E9_9PROT|nr:glutathione S-transferase family protein [Hwanghaeella grinnelliae]RVU35084.1 glutathione S-transferase family protein [Hwanghaeella grinnelliae]
MAEPVELHGMYFSVYVRIARLTLAEKGVGYSLVPLNPFAEDPPDPNRDLHPFGKMPVFMHGKARIIETQAIIRYVDEAFDGPPLQPSDALGRARQNQIIGICDSYLYKALVWGLFVEILRKPVEGGETDPGVVGASLKMTDTAFSVIETLLPEVGSDGVTLSDLYLAPILDYGLRVEAAADAAMPYPRLRGLWNHLRERSSVLDTEPSDFISDLPPHTLL